MASRKSDCAGSSSCASKVGRLKVEERQSRLATEEKDEGKRVTFKLDDRKEDADNQGMETEGRAEMKEMIRREVRREVEKD